MKKIEKIFEYIESQGIKIATFERRAGISNGYLNNTMERGADLSNKILDKIKENLKEEYDKIFADRQETVIKEAVIDSKDNLEISIKNLTEVDLINARNIERLITLLEHKMQASQTASLPPSGAEGTEDLRKKKTGIKPA